MAEPSSDKVRGIAAYAVPPAARGCTTAAVTDALRDAILDGVLKPSEWLRESELAHLFAVSRTPVREALGRLVEEGLAVKTAHHGVTVAALSVHDVVALYIVREELEGLAARLAAVKCTPELLKELEELNADMGKAADQRNVRSWRG